VNLEQLMEQVNESNRPVVVLAVIEARKNRRFYRHDLP
jgi:hypothetical protein